MNYRDFVIKELTRALYLIPEEVRDVEPFEGGYDHPEIVTVGNKRSGSLIVTLQAYHLLVIRYDFDGKEAVMSFQGDLKDSKHVYSYVEASEQGGAPFIAFLEAARVEVLSRLLALATGESA